jgi:WD40 repeat protein
MRRLIPVALGFCGFALQAAEPAAPPRDPVLRIETGMHTAAIRQIALDEAQRFLVTASDDKTVRVWELATGKAQRVIRIPIGPGLEGGLQSVAITPDGQIIAASGVTCSSWQGKFCTYFLQRETGRVDGRLWGQPDEVSQLAYSPDGRFLAIGYFNKAGLQIYGTSKYPLLASDKDYGGTVTALDFSRAGRLVTGTIDGVIRTYSLGNDGSLKLLARRTAPEGQAISAVQFSPDGTKIAYATRLVRSTVVLRSTDLEPLQTPDVSGLSGMLYTLAWSDDGQSLYGTGSTRVPNDVHQVIRAWSGPSLGEHRDFQVDATDTILALHSVRQGGVVYAASEGSFGLVAADGKRQSRATAIADFRDSEKTFAVAGDGSGIAFSYLLNGQAAARFTLPDRNLQAGVGADARWVPPVIDDGQLRITDWRQSTSPKINGTPLQLAPYEFSRSVALLPDRTGFLLGTDFALRLYNRNGTLRWQAPESRLTWAVNVTPDGRLAVAAMDDGTIRWYRLSDGQPLLTFFPHPDRKRWVMWTPSGYYDASPGAEDLIGWHMNGDVNSAADFFPAGRFRDTYYRPDVVAQVLKSADERGALQLANDQAGRRPPQASIAQQLPPVVEILSPAAGASVANTRVTARFRVRAPSGEPVTNVKVLVNGRPITTRALVVKARPAAEDVRELEIDIPEADSEISIFAENRFTSSEAATVNVRWTGTRAASSVAELVKPKLYVLAVGVSQYSNSQFNLKLADKDARDFVNAMLAQKGLLYRDVVVKLLTNAQATKEEILDGLDWVRRETTSNDVAMVFFAGHGINDQNNYYYFVPYNIDADRLMRTGLPFSDIKNAVSSIAGKALFFVDTCHSGNAIGLAMRRGADDINSVINELASAENGVIVFSAATSSESSLERPDWNNGAFTKALVEGLGGKAAIGTSGRITYNMLNVYISERVKELTGGKQHPTVISPATVPDFPVALRR